jgi:hypothetical protein
VPVIIFFLVIGAIIPLDATLTILTPKVHIITDVNDPNELNYMSINFQISGYNQTPFMWANFSRTVLDVYEINSPSFDRFGNITYPLSSNYAGQHVSTGYCPQGTIWTPDGVYAYCDYALKDNLTLTPVPSTTNATSIQIDYEHLKGQSFNINVTHWEDAKNDSIFVIPSEVRRVALNETYDSIIQDFNVTNNSNQKIYVYQLWLFRDGYPEMNENFTEVTCNGLKLDFPQVTSYNMVQFWPVLIMQNGTKTFKVQFLAPVVP